MNSRDDRGEWGSLGFVRGETPLLSRGESWHILHSVSVSEHIGTVGADLLLGKSGGYAVGVQLARNALENLGGEGYVVKQVWKQGIMEDTYYYAK